MGSLATSRFSRGAIMVGRLLIGGVELTASPAELNLADLSTAGAVVRTKTIALASRDGDAVVDTGFDLPAKGLVLDVIVDITTAEATGTTKTIDVGLLASESGGDEDGFIVGGVTSSIGRIIGKASFTSGEPTGTTRGALLANYSATPNPNHYSTMAHVLNGTAKSLTYKLGSDATEIVGSITVVYVELA